MSTPESAGNDADTREWELGQLDASDLGSVVSFTVGGATYTGTLKGANHAISAFRSAQATTLVILVADDWRHIKTYPSSTPCRVTSPGAGGA